MFNEAQFLIPVSLMLEYWYCPRFIYYMECLKISQNEAKRNKVLIGREIHKKKNAAPEYLRKKYNIVHQEKEIYLASPDLGICGIIDEVLTDRDGNLSLIDYKFAYKKHKFKTYFRQLVFYSMLIEANYRKPVSKGYLVFTRNGSRLEEFSFNEKDKSMVRKDIQSVKDIIFKNLYPVSAKNAIKCVDCTYRKICVQ